MQLPPLFIRRPDPRPLGLNMQLEGWVTAEVLDARGHTVEERHFRNLITNSGLDYFMTNGMQQLHRAVCVGVGNRPPSPGDVALDAEVARHMPMESGSCIYSGPGEVRSTRQWLFPLGVIEANLAEVGFSPLGSYGGGVGIRQLFKDAQGNPQVVSVNREQQLRIRHDLYLRWPLGLSPSTWEVAGWGTLRGQSGFLWQSTGVDLWNFGYEYGGGLIQPHTYMQGGLGRLTRPPGVGNADTYMGADIIAPGYDIIYNFGWSPDPYTLGTFRRTKSTELGPELYNRDLNFIALGNGYYNSNYLPAWAFYLEDPTSVTKLDTHRLALKVEWRVSRELP